jgi:hypothetical protein
LLAGILDNEPADFSHEGGPLSTDAGLEDQNDPIAWDNGRDFAMEGTFRGNIPTFL